MLGGQFLGRGFLSCVAESATWFCFGAVAGLREETRMIPYSCASRSSLQTAAHTDGMRSRQRKNAEINETRNISAMSATALRWPCRLYSARSSNSLSKYNPAYVEGQNKQRDSERSWQLSSLTDADDAHYVLNNCNTYPVYSGAIQLHISIQSRRYTL